MAPNAIAIFSSLLCRGEDSPQSAVINYELMSREPSKGEIVVWVDGAQLVEHCSLIFRRLNHQVEAQQILVDYHLLRFEQQPRNAFRSHMSAETGRNQAAHAPRKLTELSSILLYRNPAQYQKSRHTTMSPSRFVYPSPIVAKKWKS